MKKILIISIVVIAISAFFYFIISLPSQNIQNQTLITNYNKQKNELLNSLGQSNKGLSSELKCVLQINSKWEDLLSKMCLDNSAIDNNFNATEWMNCRENVIQSAEFKAINCN
jgi:capsular polysaccharide biosynthesis protein